jgi:DNA polymerase III sliding clamp (beta) subunit (PCNA family)
LTNLLEKTQSKTLQISQILDEGFVRFESSEFLLYARELSEKYKFPSRYSKYDQRQSKYEFRFDAEHLKAALKRLSLARSIAEWSYPHSMRLRLSQDSALATLESCHEHLGTEYLCCSGTGEVDILVNFDYLVEVLNPIEKKVLLSVNEKFEAPILIRDEDNKNVYVYVMPMKPDKNQSDL